MQEMILNEVSWKEHLEVTKAWHLISSSRPAASKAAAAAAAEMAGNASKTSTRRCNASESGIFILTNEKCPHSPPFHILGL